MSLIAAITLNTLTASKAVCRYSAFVAGNQGMRVEVSGIGFGISVDLRQEKPTGSGR